jgi:hypothetical protein
MDSIHSPANFKELRSVRIPVSSASLLLLLLLSSNPAVCQLGNFTQCCVHNPTRKSTALLNQDFFGAMEQAHMFLIAYFEEGIYDTDMQGLLLHAFALYCTA